MREIIKKYWDILGGTLTGLIITALVKFQLEPVQLIYSIVILILVLIGVFKIVKQAIEKNRAKRPKKRKQTLIDDVVDSQKPIKAINLAQEPTKEGEKLGKLLLEILRGGKKVMTKIKKFFDKFKGYLLTIALTILSLVEMFGGFINDAMGDVLTVKGVNMLSALTLLCAIIVGCISNGWSKEQMEKIKALFSKSSSDELVTSEIKKTLKADETKLKEQEKTLATKETELENLESQLESANNTYEAKKKMLGMSTPLATEADVQNAANAVVNIQAAIVNKQADVDATKNEITNLTTIINALKSQL